MSNKWKRRLMVTAAIVSLTVLAVVLLGCVTRPNPRLPQPCATWQAPDGTWMEEDNEPVDDDPCDREPDSKPSSKAPSVVKTTKPAAANTKPVPRVTRR